MEKKKQIKKLKEETVEITELGMLVSIFCGGK